MTSAQDTDLRKLNSSDKDELAVSRESTKTEKMKSGIDREEKGGHTPRNSAKPAELRELAEDLLQSVWGLCL